VATGIVTDEGKDKKKNIIQLLHNQDNARKQKLHGTAGRTNAPTRPQQSKSSGLLHYDSSINQPLTQLAEVYHALPHSPPVH